MQPFFLIALFILGLIIGSFLTALTYRLPRGLGIAKGRSICDSCKAKLAWYDNIPLLSYLFLRGRCRRCRKRVSLRYPLIEVSTALTFSAIGFYLNECGPSSLTGVNTICYWQNTLGVWSLPFFLLVASSLIAIFVMDFEFQIIPDGIVFTLFITAFLASLKITDDMFYQKLASGFISSLFLLFLNIATNGRGMGLGDVKLALFGGLFLGYPFILTWFFLSFTIGAFVGIALILFGRAKFGKQIAFGPFLVFSFFLTFFYGDKLTSLLIPF